MESIRLPRFNRVPNLPPIQLTIRDREIIGQLHRNRFLSSSHILSLTGGSPQQTLRRLQLLYHHGFLERPRAQIDYYHRGGSRHIVYGLGNKGAAVVEHDHGITIHPERWGEKSRSVGRIYLEHALSVSDVTVAFELACRENGRIRLITGRELLHSSNGNQPPQPFNWNVSVNGTSLGLIPDRAFGLDFGDECRNRAYFFLEADRGTMPVKRAGLTQTSFYRKLLAYEATWSQSIHRTRFGFHRFRVLTVTTSAERVDSLVNVCRQLEHGHGLFLFTDRSSIAKPPGVFGPIWRTARAGEKTNMLT